MMKRYFLILIALAAFNTGCQQIDDPTPTRTPVAGEALQITSSFGVREQGKSKATSVAFESGDKVGVYMVDYTNATTPGTLKTYKKSVLQPDGNVAHNEKYTSDASGTLTIMPPVFYTKEVPKVDLYAYYPQDDSYSGASDVTKIPFTVKTDQNKDRGMTLSDLCWSKVGAQVPQAQGVAMTFTHLFSKIEVEITVPQTFASGRVVDKIDIFEFNDIKISSQLNMNNGDVLLQGTAVKNIKPLVKTNKSTVGNNYVYAYEMIAPAQAYTAGNNLVSFEIDFTVGDNLKIEYKIPANIFDTYGTSTQKSKNHKIVLSLTDKAEVVLINNATTITDWTAGVTQTKDFTNNITTVFSTTVATPNITTANRVKVTTTADKSASTFVEYDIKNSDVAGSVTMAGNVCSFKFTVKSGSPFDYGFQITKLEFFNGETSLGSKTLTSARVYSPTAMNLGAL